MSVAPNFLAISWRDSWRDIATTRSAPSWAAARTPHRPTAPSPTTTAVPPWAPEPSPDITAACQPVAITSVRASRSGYIAASGVSSSLTREPSAWFTRAYSLCPLTVKPRFSQTDWTPARQCGQVLSQWSNGTITKSPGLKSRTSAPTSSMTPMHSWPMVRGSSISPLEPR